MGKDLISRKDAIDALSTPHGILYPIRTIEDLPSVQPERKKGKWIEIKNSNGAVIALRCDQCLMSPKNGVRSDFCPNCGSDNRG